MQLSQIINRGVGGGDRTASSLESYLEVFDKILVGEQLPMRGTFHQMEAQCSKIDCNLRLLEQYQEKFSSILKSVQEVN